MMLTKAMMTMTMRFTWPSLAWIFCGWEAKITKDSPPSGSKSYNFYCDQENGENYDCDRDLDDENGENHDCDEYPSP